MSPTAWLVVGAVAWCVLAVPVAVVIARAIDPGETHATDYDEFEPLGLPVDVLGPLEIEFEFRRLTDPLEAEREQRLGGLW